jgi:cystathionine beta-synthase
MSHDVQTLPPGAPLSDLIAQLRKGLVAVIADDRGFHGLVTRFDLLNHLRKGLS